jgi:hypothetical protein
MFESMSPSAVNLSNNMDGNRDRNSSSCAGGAAQVAGGVSSEIMIRIDR